MFKNILFLSIAVFTINFAQTDIDSSNIYAFYYNNIRYEIVKENRNWIEAAQIADARNGILAEINSREEQDSIYYYLQNAEINIENTIAPDGGGASYVWIGGNDLEEEGMWIWDGNNDNYGPQFWQGTFSEGNVVDSLYNNWGNEPDNFSNQDALGLALTNWARGKAGEWNDLQSNNDLYFIIEYDSSTIKLNSFDYSYNQKQINIKSNFDINYDSIEVFINDKLFYTFENVTIDDSLLSIPYPNVSSEILQLRIFAYNLGKIAVSKEFKIEVLAKIGGFNSYVTDFEDLPTQDFLGEEFEIGKPFPFRNNAIHSIHDYENSANITYTLLKPIIVNEVNSVMKFSEVVIVEPGDEGSLFGDKNFKDFVIVEGCNNLGEWKSLLSGYDSREFPEWFDAWNNGALLRNLYKTRILYLTDTFDTQDTILIRFRLYSDNEINGWGWTIDSLQIQDVLSDIESMNINNQFKLFQNYPNPFNPSTNINFTIPKSDFVSLRVYSSQGELVSTIINKKLNKGNYSINFNGEKLASGIYFYQLNTTLFKKTNKMVLLK
ncbi:MAG: T9SS type A sorting domain-containing protein [Ignavibacteriales bacterium]|nr:T9SS type A sorting domain-containing protein [Ignavibacteriales bacterium]